MQMARGERDKDTLSTHLQAAADQLRAIVKDKEESDAIVIRK